MQVCVSPGVQRSSSSIRVSQSSSRPLQASTGTWQELRLHEAVHVTTPEEPQLVVHVCVSPAQQLKSSSHGPSQSSSSPLQISEVGLQASGGGTMQFSVQVPVPVEPQEVVQEVTELFLHGKPSSMSPSQSSSNPLQISTSLVPLQLVSQFLSPSLSDQPSLHRMVQTRLLHTGWALDPAEQTTPQLPQLAGSMLMSTQDPRQLILPPGHSMRHSPSLQTSIASHPLPQSPQCSWFEAGSMQAPSHRICPAGHPESSASPSRTWSDSVSAASGDAPPPFEHASAARSAAPISVIRDDRLTCSMAAFRGCGKQTPIIDALARGCNSTVPHHSSPPRLISPPPPHPG